MISGWANESPAHTDRLVREPGALFGATSGELVDSPRNRLRYCRIRFAELATVKKKPHQERGVTTDWATSGS